MQVKQTFTDRVINYFDPVKGKARLKARAEMAMYNGYTGASKTRRSLLNWNAKGGDADSVTSLDLPDLRDRSSDLIRNTPVALSAINTPCTSVVGTGLKLKSQIDRKYLGLTDEAADEWEENAERRFHAWAKSKECDISRTQNFYQLQDLGLRSPLERGDCFVLLPLLERIGSPFRLKLNFIEADRVCNENNLRNSQSLVDGIELDGVGAPKLCHILKQHPGSTTRNNYQWDKVPFFGNRSGRRNILHLMRKKRIGQHRGIPYLAPVVEELKQLTSLTENELMASVVNSLFTVILTDDSGNGLDDDPTIEKDATQNGNSDLKLGNGTMVELDSRAKIDFANPNRPNSAFDPFFVAIVRQIGAGIEIPFEILIKHFTASYSASRAALQEAWRFFKVMRGWLVSELCEPVYEAFLFDEISRGNIKAPGFLTDFMVRQAYLGADWIGPPQGQLDPYKEFQADALAEDRGWKTARENTAEKTGGDWERKHKQRAKEVKMRKEDGLEIKQNSNQQMDSVDNTKDEE